MYYKIFAIFVNFAENGNHGCDEKCPFCKWQLKNYNQYYCPSKEDLYKAHLAAPQHMWQISGGGDPLYHFDKNKDKLKEIAEYGHSLGHKIQLLTKKVDVALKYYNELKDYIDFWYFSVNSLPTNTFIEFAKKVNEIDKISVNTIIKIKNNEIDWDHLNKIYISYKPYVFKTFFRENFITPFKDNNWLEIGKEWLKSHPKSSLLSANVKGSGVLFNGEITTCKQIDLDYLL